MNPLFGPIRRQRGDTKNVEVKKLCLLVADDSVNTNYLQLMAFISRPNAKNNFYVNPRNKTKMYPSKRDTPPQFLLNNSLTFSH